MAVCHWCGQDQAEVALRGWLVPLRQHDLILRVDSRSDGRERRRGFLTGATTVNGGLELLRWPEKRALDSEGPETRGRFGEARRGTASSMVALALAGEV